MGAVSDLEKGKKIVLSKQGNNRVIVRVMIEVLHNPVQLT